MQNAELTQHLILLEEHMDAIVLALKRIETPSALSLVAQRLGSIEASQARIELALALRVPPAEIRQAIEDAFDALGLVVQLREVYFNQANEIAAQGVDLDALTVTINRLLAQLREHVVIWRLGDTERRGAR